MTEKTDLKIGAIKELLMTASPRQMGPSWVANRETEQWTAIDQERIFAMSSSCDKKEFNPPTKGLTVSFPTSLLHLAEIHHQVSDEVVQSSVNRFEKFIKGLKTEYPSFNEFRNSDAFADFEMDIGDDDVLDTTPTVDELTDGYTEEELNPKKPRYY